MHTVAEHQQLTRQHAQTFAQKPHRIAHTQTVSRNVEPQPLTPCIGCCQAQLWLVAVAPWTTVYTLIRCLTLKVLILQVAGPPPAIHGAVNTRAHVSLHIPEVATGTILCADLTRSAVSPKQGLPGVLVAYHLGLQHKQAVCMSCTA